MSILSITSYFPEMPSSRQMLRNASGLAITAIALCALSNLPLVSAGHCEDSEEICIRMCLGGGDGREAGAGLIGCKLAYWACIAMGR